MKQIKPKMSNDVIIAKLGHMRFSKNNTGLVFRWPGEDELQDLTLVEESLISVISVVVALQKIESMLVVGRDRIMQQVVTSHSATPHSS